LTAAPSLDDLLPSDVRVVATSRLATRLVLDFIGQRRSIGLPAVRGRTLWHLATAPCIVEQPNGLGRLETDLPDAAIVVTTSCGVPVPPNIDRVVHLRGDAAAGRARPLAIARSLHRRFAHMPGVFPVMPTVESARFVVLATASVGALIDVAAPRGLGVAVLGTALPEYAGGVRFDVHPEAVESEVVAYAGAVAGVLADMRGP